MALNRISQILAHISLADDPRPDADLLAAYLKNRDEQAFVSLIHRHTPGIRAACRGWLNSASDIDDATQATFLVFLKRAGSIRKGASLGPWLYRTAGFVARKLKQQSKRTVPFPDPLVEKLTIDPLPDERVVESEIAKLPEPYRLVMQLHYLAGLSAASVAERLGCPRTTVLTRLSRGREMLQRKLAALGRSPATLTLPLVLSLAVPPEWARSFARTALDLVSGSLDARAVAFSRSATLSKGVVNAMFWKKMQLVTVAIMIATGLGGLALGQRISGESPVKKPVADPVATTNSVQPPAPLKPAEDGPVVASVRREAVIRMPVGTFMKEFEMPPYGSGRIVWHYEGDRVHGQITATAMGVDVDCSTESEISMASTGTIYGVLTQFKINSVKIPAELKGELAGVDFNKAWPLIEPIVNESLTDLPFSYTFRLNGDNLTLSQFRILLSGPNPLGKLGGIASTNNDSVLKMLSYFQMLGTSLEGTYTLTDGEIDVQKNRAPLKKSTIPLIRKK